jgi:hypothetical protein
VTLDGSTTRAHGFRPLWRVEDSRLSSLPDTVYSGSRKKTFVETLALERFTVHSDAMSNSGGGPYYWCLRHNRVETDDNVCPAVRTLGPFETAEDAEAALAKVAERNEQWDAEDARWRGEAP